MTRLVRREPIRTRWSAGSIPLDEESKLKLSVSSIPAEITSLKAKDLPERTAAAYLNALASKLASADEFWVAAADAIKPGNRGDADSTVLSRTIAIALAKRGYSVIRRLIRNPASA